MPRDGRGGLAAGAVGPRMRGAAFLCVSVHAGELVAAAVPPPPTSGRRLCCVWRSGGGHPAPPSTHHASRLPPFLHRRPQSHRRLTGAPPPRSWRSMSRSTPPSMPTQWSATRSARWGRGGLGGPPSGLNRALSLDQTALPPDHDRHPNGEGGGSLLHPGQKRAAEAAAEWAMSGSHRATRPLSLFRPAYTPP